MSIEFSRHYLYLNRDPADDESFSAEDVMEAISEDLLRDGNVDLALQRAFRWGFQTREGNHVGGMRELLQRLRERKQQMLDQHDFGSMFNDLKRELQEIVDLERSTLQERTEQAKAQENDGAAGFLERKQERLQSLPPSAPDQLQQLRDYEFVNQEAQRRFSELLEQLQEQVSESLFRNIVDSMGDDADGLQDTAEFLKDVNDALEAGRRGEQVDLDKLNNKWAQQLGGRVQSLEELQDRLMQMMAASQKLMGMLSPSQRQELAQMLNQAAEGSELGEQLMRLRQNLPLPAMQPQEGGEGGEELSLDMAMDLMERLSAMEQMEGQLRDVGGYDDLQGLDDALLHEVLSDEEQEWLNHWEKIRDELEDAGFLNQKGDALELTPRAIRKIGERALMDIFANLHEGLLGQHDLRKLGQSGELGDTSSQWQFGDPFQLNLSKTVMNAVSRNGAGAPVQLHPDDFEVTDRDIRASTATVMLIDLSRSMLQNGCWDSAKRAALALDTLIRSKFPRDMLELIGFSATAERLTVHDLPTLEWNEYNFGTNLQHGLQLGRELLARERGRHRQMIVITDGEPTAHIQDGELYFHYPPLRETIEETLKEVVRCTRDGIRINTFLLEQTPYMRKFMEDLMRINHGRVIDASPGKLGSYVMHDFVQGRVFDRFA